ncbi:MAG TPA: hypothetical protein VF796_25565 [Humisphaera sp.]
MLHAIKVYGQPRDPGTIRAVGVLRAMNTPFDFFDLDHDRHAAAWVRWKNGGAATPTVLVGLKVLANPTEADLRDAVAATARRAEAAPAMN